MRALLLVALLASSVLGGCAEEDRPTAVSDDDFDGLGLQASETTGVIRGVVVDTSVVPVVGVTVRVVGAPAFVTETDADGRFGFGGVPPGTHFVNFTSPLYAPVQVAVSVQAGVRDPPVLQVQVERLFSQDPYAEGQHINGYINCGYSAVLSSPCVIDYTQLLPVCPGGCVPQLYGITGDIRRFIVPIYDGWQSRINEMVWESSTGTSASLSMTVSFYNRTTSDTYAGTAGPSPLRHKMDMDPERTHPDWIPPEGLHDYLVFVNPSTAGSGLPAALVLEQRFELFSYTFYWGFPPEDWSFVRGDPKPF